MKYAWEHPQWPQLTWDLEAAQSSLYRYANLSGRLTGAFSQLQTDLREEAIIDLMVSEAINTSQIEGERLDREDVRSSIKRYLGLQPDRNVTNPKAAGIAALMVDVRRHFAQGIDEDKLYHWHRLILPESDSMILSDITPGQWRTADTPMQILSGPIGYETVHYEAPPAADVPVHMAKLLQWYQKSTPGKGSHLPGPARAAVAHLWFEIIHPFEDGNGRVGRALAEHALAQDMGAPTLLSLSTTIDRRRDEYYYQLQKASGPELDITEWVCWFCDATLEAQESALQRVDHILLKTQFWQIHESTDLNDRQQKVLNKLFDYRPGEFEGGMSARKYGNLTSCSKATATRDLQELVAKGCLERLPGGGRSARYALNLPGSQPAAGWNDVDFTSIELTREPSPIDPDRHSR